MGEHDANKPVAIQSCAWLQGIWFTSEAGRLERVWQKGLKGRSPWGKEALKEGSETNQCLVLGRLLQAVAVMGTVSNRHTRGTELFSH